MNRTPLVTLLIVATVLLCQVAWAAKEDDSVSSGAEALKQLRVDRGMDTEGVDVEEAISKFFKPERVDEGTYPPSELWEHDMDLRREKPEQVGMSGRFFAKYSSDEISDVDKWEKELELAFTYKDWDANFRFSDVNAFAYEKDPFRWEKGTIRYKHDDYKVTLGSFGALFGRGLALNSYEDRTLEHDNELEGIKVEAAAGDAEYTALWGTYKNRDQKTSSDVSAARVKVALNEETDLAVHAVEVEFPHGSYAPETPNKFDYKIYGGDLFWRPGDFTLFGEYATLQRGENEFASHSWDVNGDKGTGYYLNANYSGDGYSLTAEYKDYEYLAQPFSVVPPLRRFKEKATSDANDDKGYSFELAWNPFDNGSMFNFGYEQDNVHAKGMPYTEFSAVYTSPAKGKTSWIGEYWTVNAQGDRHQIDRLTLNHRFDEDWSGTTLIERERLSADYFKAYFDHIIELEVAFQSKFNAVYTYETKGGETAATERSAWKLWEFRYRPDERQEINLGTGARRAGFVCSGGVCRLEPAFEGWRLDYLIRF